MLKIQNFTINILIKEKIKNWLIIKKKIDKIKTKIKFKLNKNKINVYIKKENKILLFTKNLINDKLNILFIEIFKIKKVKDVIILFKLLNTKIFLRFYIFLFKKTPFDILLIII